MSSITTHVLDTSIGRPARDIVVELHVLFGDEWRDVGRGTTDEDGRLRDLLPEGHLLVPGTYRLTFATGAYYESNGQRGAYFYPAVAIVFSVRDVNAHYHVPLLLSPFGYSTYRGS
jgi:5-hydroxyisourate hydrolase